MKNAIDSPIVYNNDEEKVWPSSGRGENLATQENAKLGFNRDNMQCVGGKVDLNLNFILTSCGAY